MEPQKKQRIAVQGLRRSDPGTLLVLTQEALRATLGRLDPATLADLLALSELDSGLGVALTRDLRHFRDQVFREISDLPDSPVLAEFVRDLEVVEPKRVPTCLREAVAAILPGRKHPEATSALQDLLTRWEGTEPEPVVLPAPQAARRPSSSSTAAPSAPAPARERVPSPPPTRRVKVPAAQVDERRVTWIEEEVMQRLEQYGAAGLKEAVVVAAARHRAPWKDLTEDEVLTVLRRLKRENRLRNSAGRWMTIART